MDCFLCMMNSYFKRLQYNKEKDFDYFLEIFQKLVDELEKNKVALERL